MPDNAPFFSKEPSRVELLVVFAIAAVLTWWSAELAWKAWIGTPDVANFRHFAEPSSTKSETKGVYLFSIVVAELFVLLMLLLGACMPRRVRDRLPPARRSSVYWMPIFFLLCFWGGSVHSSRALEAARRLEHAPGSAATPGPQVYR